MSCTKFETMRGSDDLVEHARSCPDCFRQAESERALQRFFASRPLPAAAGYAVRLPRHTRMASLLWVAVLAAAPLTMVVTSKPLTGAATAGCVALALLCFEFVFAD